MNRKNLSCVVKTFRFPPDLVEDMERVIFFATDKEGKKRYKNMTEFLKTAMSNLIRPERRALEEEGVIWEHLVPNYTKSLKKE